MKIYIKIFSIVMLITVAFCGENNALYYPYEPVLYGNFRYFISAAFEKPFLSVGDQLHTANFRFFIGEKKFGSLGISIDHMGNQYLTTQFGKFYYILPRIRFGRFSSGIWLAPGVARIGYFTANFHRFDFSDDVFAQKNSKFSPLADAGIFANYKNFALNIWGENLYPPNLSLSNSSDVKEPISANFILRYKIGTFVPWAGGLFDKRTNELYPTFGLTWLYRGWSVSAGYEKNTVRANLYAPVVLGKVWTRYETGYHTASKDVASADMTSHCIGIDILFPHLKPPPPPKTNLVIEPGELPDLWTMDTAYFSAAVVNRSETKSESTEVSLFAVAEDETICVGVKSVPEIEPGKEHLAQFVWIPPHPGSYKLVFTADDDGSHFPGIFGKLDESQEDDNRYTHNLLTLGKLVVSVSPLLQVLSIPSVTFVRQDEPIVPVVFFDSSSATVPARFDTMLSIVAQRLQLNPDVVVELKGYIDPESDNNNLDYAMERMDSVAQRLIRLGVPPSSIIKIDTSEYDPTKPRISLIRKDIPQKEKRMISEENRRVEMSARFQNIPLLVYEFNLPAGSQKIPKKNREVLDTVAEKLAGVLCSDHDAIILVEGIPAYDDDPVDVLRSLDVVRKYLLPRLQVFCPLERIPISLGEGDTKKTKVRVWLSAEKIIFKPVEQAEVAKEFKIPDDVRRNLIIISVNNPEMVQKYKIFAYNEDTYDTVRTFAAGDGPPPSQVVWNWRDDNGNLIDPRGTYRIALNITDELGQEYNILSDPIWVIVEKREHRLESSIVVQFSFDEAVTESKYLESRLEEFARLIIDKSQIPDNSVTVRLTGHTDIIGTPIRNQKLSEIRAEKELKNLRNLMKFVLGIDTDIELDQWLKRNNIKLESRGVRDTQPYTIERYRNNEFQKVLIGDNSKPEGRSINRRVVIEIEEMIKK